MAWIGEAERAGLSSLDELDIKLAVLRQALIEGEASGWADYGIRTLRAELDQQDCSA